jgi:YD repeat-containing protein
MRRSRGAGHTDTTVDGLGQPFTVSNPHRSSSSPSDGITTFIYDALGRIRSQTHPDGFSLQWSYAGNITAFLDEASHLWQRTSDALGRLTNVLEPTGASTGYIYDALGNLRTVNQNGVSGSGDTPRVRTFIYDSLSRLVDACNPESIPAGSVCSTTGPWSEIYGYDANGNMNSKTDARGIATSYFYDALNRLTQKSYNDGVTSTAIYGYDTSSITFVPAAGSSSPRLTATLANTIGRMVFASDTSGGTLYAYSYDAMGRLKNQWVSTPSYNTGASPVFLTTSNYDLAGNVTSLTYPDGLTLNQTWDSGGHLTKITNASNNYPYLSNATYWPNGSPSALFYGNGVGNGYDINNRLQTNETGITRLSSGVLGNINLSVKEYCYGPNTSELSSTIPGCTNTAGNPNGIPNTGNIWQIMDILNAAATQNFNYDNLNRLTFFQQAQQLASESQNPQQSYGYDSFGNLNQLNGTLNDNVTYAANNQINNNGYAYDQAGNVTSYSNGMVPPPAFAYDAENRLININGGGVAIYTYDANGDRIRKDKGSDWTEYVRFNGLPLAEKSPDGTWSDYIFANGQRIARADNYDIRIHMSGTNCRTAGATQTILPERMRLPLLTRTRSVRETS